MRTLAAAVAVPIGAVLHGLSFLGGRVATQVAIAITAVMLATLGVLVVSAPSGTNATPPSVVVPVTSAAVRTDLRVGQPLQATITVAFSVPMNRLSVERSLRVVPETAVGFAWDESGTTLSVRPVTRWQAGTLHTITVDAGTLAASGAPMSASLRAAFLTRSAASGTIAITSPLGSLAALDTAFVLTFDRAVDPATVADGLRTEPALTGTVVRVGRRGSVRYVFTPSAPLLPRSVYRLWLASTVRDESNGPVSATTLSIRTAGGPAVIRFRPRDGTAAVNPSVDVSVRFTEPMDRASTKAAVTVTANGKPISGTIAFADRDTVLVFHPRAAFRPDQKVVMTVAATARSAAGAPLGSAVSGTFTTTAGPAGRSSAPRVVAQIPVDGSVGGGTWAAVESYYLTLMNCTRTGGLVTSGGACSSPGGRAVAPLWIDSGISSSVTRPYAKLLATRNACNHFIGGTPGDRLRRAGYTSYIWAENLGCRSGNPMTAVLGSHLFFQAERSYNGGHYVNLMNANYDRVGIGVWVSSGRVRLVVDFYHPR